MAGWRILTATLRLTRTLTPIGFYLVSYVLFIIMRRVFATASTKLRRAGSAKNMHLLYAYAIQVLFLFLPTISRRIGQTLQACNEYDGGDQGIVRYLAADLSISCDSNPRYDTMYSYALVMLILYVCFVCVGVLTRVGPGGGLDRRQPRSTVRIFDV